MPTSDLAILLIYSLIFSLTLRDTCTQLGAEEPYYDWVEWAARGK